MFKRFVEVTLVISFAFAGPTAQAFFDPPWITPSAPTAGQTISVNIHGGICDVFVDAPGYPQITIQGNTIHIVRYGWHEGFQDFCIFGDWMIADALGSFPSGDYVVTADFLYDDPLFGPTTINLGTVPFTVTGATTLEPVPTLDVSGGLASVVLVLGSAIWAFRTRRRSTR